MVLELHRAGGLNYSSTVAMYFCDPRRQLCRVADRRGQTHQLGLFWELHNYFLPNWTPIGILKKVNLIEND